MADKKKKIFSTSKDVSAPRRPIILKSDRDNSKDATKEKKEAEKQPTIILKTREQSTPKEERPTSPRSIKTNEDGPTPSKIAQNENKEKKTTEKPTPPLKYMSEPVTLLDENLEFNNAAMEFLHDSSLNYLVVGVIGTQGSGKSMIMNLLAKNVLDQNICRDILSSHELPNGGVFEANEIPNENQEGLDFVDDPEIVPERGFKFKMQDIEQVEKGVGCTKGVDMYITSDRVILLDCQALWSPSQLNESGPNPMTTKTANSLTIDCLQIASFLISVCHVLIAVQDWFMDNNFIRYIETAEMLIPAMASCNSASSQDSEVSNSASQPHGGTQPHLLLVQNRSELEDFTPHEVKTMQDVYRHVFRESELQLTSGMYMYSDTNMNGMHVDNVRKTYSVEACGSPINLFLLPEIYGDFYNRDIYRGHPPFEELAKRLRWMVLGVNRHQITNIPNLSEKGWFQYCNRTWENTRKCSFFVEYDKLLA